MLVSGRLHVLGPWNLYLNVGSAGSLLGEVLLLPGRAVEVLRGLVQKLVGGGAAHGKVDVLR